jgi:hypothetical protein
MEMPAHACSVCTSVTSSGVSPNQEHLNVVKL